MSGSCKISAFGLLLIFSQISAILSADIVPVILLYAKSPPSTQSVDALRIMSKNEFIDVVSEIVGGSQHPIVVFTKDNLCVEEISQAKLNLNKLHTRYLPSVEAPMAILENFEFYNVTYEEKPETINDGQVTIVRVDNLSVVSEIYKDLVTKNSKVIGVVAGASCSYSRSERTRRAIIAPKTDDSVTVDTERVLLHSGKGFFLRPSVSENFTNLGQPVAKSVSNETSVRLDLTFPPIDDSAETILRLNFELSSTKYWYLTSIEYEINSTSTPLTLTHSPQIYFPSGFSYHCAQNTLFYHNNTVLYLNITNLQVQIDPKVFIGNSTAVFSDGWDCVGFTTIPILSGIFVTAILALIMIWALTMILDIRTMDRFDDPKGKTITIAASE